MARATWDAMYDQLTPYYGGVPLWRSTQDMLDAFWLSNGFTDIPEGDALLAFYQSKGAVGTALGDVENDYWGRIGPAVLKDLGAVFALDARNSKVGEQWALNMGSGGQVLRARYGSVGRAEIRNGVGVLFPNSGTDYVSIPMPSPTDIEIIVRLLNDPCVGGTPYPLGNFGSNMSWGALRDSTQLLMIITKDSGGSNTVTASCDRSARPDIASGAWYWARI